LRNLVTGTVDPLARRTTISLDALGRPVTWMDAKAQVITLTYSARGEILAEVYGDGSRVTTSYDALSQPRTIVDATGWYTMTYSGRGEKLTDQAPQHPGNGILTHGYDGVGNRTLLHSWLGRQTMAFDPVSRITAMWDAESPAS